MNESGRHPDWTAALLECTTGRAVVEARLMRNGQLGALTPCSEEKYAERIHSSRSACD